MLARVSGALIEVRFQRGLYLPEADLWLDPWDPKPWAFVSHAHADHFARHGRVLCSDVTATLVQDRFHLAVERLEPVPCHTPTEHGGFRFCLLPAGHIAGSAMLHVTRLADGATLLYTGDFKVRHGRTSEPAVFRQADILILETTFGLPAYVFPPAQEIEMQVLRFVNDAIADGEVPVLLGYSLGKAQEALALLTSHGIPAVLHPSVAEMTASCRKASIPGLPEPVVLEAAVPPGHAVIAPPNAVRSRLIRGIQHRRVAMLSGWALNSGSAYRYRVDEVIPLSDHADHPGLLECVQQVRPVRILTVHGFEREFAAELRLRGYDAWSATGSDQLELGLLQPGHKAAPHPAATTGRHPRPACPLASFSDLCSLVGQTSSRLEKIRHLSDWLRTLEDDADLALAATWLTGRALAREKGRSTIQTGSAALRRALLRLPGAREDRYREISLSQNDAARTARLFLEDLDLQPEPLDLAGTDSFFRSLADAGGSLARIAMLADRLSTLHPAEGETLVRLLTGDLRIGLKEGLVEDAISAAFGADPAALRHAHMLLGDVGETAVMARAGRLAEATLRPFVPVKVMLASPMPDASALAAAMQQRQEDGSPAPVWLEPKYDGIRAQIHKQGDRAAIFSRDLRPLDAEFPELVSAALQIPGDFILDGEIIARADGRKLTFFDLQKRLGRQAARDDLFSAATTLPPVHFVAFDLLHDGSRSLMDMPLSTRQKRLAAIPLAGLFGQITVSRAEGAAAIEALFKKTRAAGHEGLIAKDPSSTYSPGRRGKAWLKLKTAATLDCVVVAVEQGHGRRAEVLSDYTFAVRDEASGQLRVIGKAYSGLTDAEIEELTVYFQRHTLEKQRRKLLVEPQLVLEIAFDSIQPSKRHDSGLAMRFPRIHAIRRDKSVLDIDTLQYARTLAV